MGVPKGVITTALNTHPPGTELGHPGQVGPHSHTIPILEERDLRMGGDYLGYSWGV